MSLLAHVRALLLPFEVADGNPGGFRNAPDGSLYTRAAPSYDFVTGAAASGGSSGTMVALVSAWSTSQTWAVGQVVWAPASFKPWEAKTATGAFLICSTAGNGATSGSGPALTQGQTGFADGAAAKWDWVTDAFRNGIVLANQDTGSNVLYFSSRSAIVSGSCDALQPGGSRVLPTVDPRKVFVFAAGAYSWSAYL